MATYIIEDDNVTTIKCVNGKKYGEFAVLYKLGRKTLGWTQRSNSGKWCNFRPGFMFSASDTLDIAVDVMEEHLRKCFAPVSKKINFIKKY